MYIYGCRLTKGEGNIKAMFTCGRMFINGEGIKINKKEASHYLKMTANNGHIKGMLMFGCMLQKGDEIQMKSC